MKKSVLIIILFLFNLYGVCSEFSVSDIYSDNMVIQANKPFVIIGQSHPGKEVIVRILKWKRVAKADRNGDWEVRFPRFNEGPVGTIYLKSGDERISINNAIAGEVWLCSGQSNMVFPVKLSDVKSDNGKMNQIRFFSATNESSTSPLNNLRGKWKICDLDNYGECSAVGLSFAFHLHEICPKSIGLIINAVGGTPVEAWTKLEIIKDKIYDNHIFIDRENWKKNAKTYKEQYDLKLKDWESACQKAKEEGSAIPVKPFPPFQLRESFNPGGLYNSLIFPLRNIALKGVIWYQGESNANYPIVYRQQLVDLIRNWRETFCIRNLPFYIIQLPEYKTTDDWVTLRESQSMASKLKNVNLVVSLGLGDSLDIHPTKKMELGHRVALQVAKNEYKCNVISSGPYLRRCKTESGKIKLVFNCIGSSIKSLDGKPIRNFEISNDGITFSSATVKISGNSLIVWNERMTNPSFVRYAWKNVPEQINFVNQNGIPAPPFLQKLSH
jgi:sialate O-acetylesterase